MSVKVLVGSVVAGNSGIVNDNTREVEFVAEQLAKLTEYGMGRDGGVTDTRGVTETLYRTDDGRLVVHVKDWSNWQSEPTTYSLHEVTEADLEGDGQFWALGLEAGYGRPLTLDEALAPKDEDESMVFGRPSTGMTEVSVILHDDDDD